VRVGLAREKWRKVSKEQRVSQQPLRRVPPSLPPDFARRAFDVRVRPTEARIDRAALAHNFKEAQRCAPRSKVLAVVKADAYGHGAILSARVFVEAGAEWLGTALVEEALQLRRAGIRAKILVLGGQYTDFSLLITNRITPVIYRADQLDAYAAAARTEGVAVDAHLKVDTGMGRIGVLPHDLPALLEHARTHPEIRITGLLSHFANADLRDPAATQRALELFATAREQVLAAGQPLVLCHLANSAATLDLPSSHFDMVRPGLMLYGAVPAPRFAGLASLSPALTWATGISHLKTIAAGTPISYGHKWVARRTSVIATMPIGYADGYRRQMTNIGQVLIRGRRCAIAGTVCMDMMMADVTDVPGVALGDEVILLGTQGHEHLDVGELADRCQTIAYEIFCDISARVPRVALQE
jgi:alanine racemase